MAAGMNKAVFEFCMKHSDDPKNRTEGIPKRDQADYEWLKKALAEIKSDYERMENCLGIVNSKEVTDVESKEVAMEEMLYFVEDLDNAVDYCKKLKGGKDLIALLSNATPPTLRAGAANLLGTMAQNNLICQSILFTDGALPALVKQLIKEANNEARTKLIYAISSIVRGNKDLITAFFKTENGVQSILNCLNFHETDRRSCKKALFLITALWRDIPDMERPELPHGAATLAAVAALAEDDSIDSQSLAADYMLELIKYGFGSALAEHNANPSLLQDTDERQKVALALEGVGL